MADRRAGAQFVLAGDDAPARPVGDDRGGQYVRQPCYVFAAVLGAAADDDERTFGRFEQADRRVQPVGVDLRRWIDRGGQIRRRALDRRFPDVDRHLDPDRPAPARLHRRDGRLQQGVGFAAAGDRGGLLGQPRQDAELVGQLVQHPEPLADGAQRDLAGQRQHRRVGRVGRGERGRRVEEARSRHDGEGLGPAGRQRRAQRHVGCALFVPRRNRLQPVLLVVEGVEEIVVLHAGQAVKVFDPVPDQGLDDEFGDGVGHGSGLRRLGAR